MVLTCQRWFWVAIGSMACASATMAEKNDSSAIAGSNASATSAMSLALTYPVLPARYEVQAEDSQAPAQGAADLAKKLANPISDLISIPFQLNYDTGYGPKDADRVTLNIQPVIPFTISEDWNLITRTIIPVIYQGSVAESVDSDFGLGDITQSFFFSPKDTVGGWIIGAGPVALWPTGTDPQLRNESFGLGPTLIALRQDHGWTYGALANHIWSVTNSDDKEQVNATFLQPFLAYTWPTATTITLNTETSFDWNEDQWTVPLNLMVSQVMKIGSQPVSFQVGGRYYAESPDGGPEWGLRFAFTLMFPK